MGHLFHTVKVGALQSFLKSTRHKGDTEFRYKFAVVERIPANCVGQKLSRSERACNCTERENTDAAQCKCAVKLDAASAYLHHGTHTYLPMARTLTLSSPYAPLRTPPPLEQMSN